MTLAEFGNLGETLSGIAVLVSLIYLIVELRRNTRTIRTNSAWNSTVALAELCEVIAPNPQLSGLCVRALDPNTDPEDLSPGEFAQFFFVCRSVLYKYEAQWFLWSEGSLSDEMWQNAPGGRRLSFRFPCQVASGSEKWISISTRKAS